MAPCVYIVYRAVGAGPAGAAAAGPKFGQKAADVYVERSHAFNYARGVKHE